MAKTYYTSLNSRSLAGRELVEDIRSLPVEQQEEILQAASPDIERSPSQRRLEIAQGIVLLGVVVPGLVIYFANDIGLEAIILFLAIVTLAVFWMSRDVSCPPARAATKSYVFHFEQKGEFKEGKAWPSSDL